MRLQGRFLSMLDNSVRWTGIPARVAADLSGAPPPHSRRSLRWLPLLPITGCGALFALNFLWPSALLVSLGALVVALVPAIYLNGPLGKSSSEDDEREKQLRKDSLLFCFALLAFLNAVGSLVLLPLSHLQDWALARSFFVAAAGFMLNLTLFGCLPTLYASWQMPRTSIQ